jgi:hypothetical protein
MINKVEYISKFLIVLKKYLEENLSAENTLHGFMEESWKILKNKAKEFNC